MKMAPKQPKSLIAALSCCLVFLLVPTGASGAYSQPEGTASSSSLRRLTPTYLSHPLPDQLERRTGGRGTQVAISLERVKNPDDAPGYKKKKKFPITWLRNQYPFNAYQKKKRKEAYKSPPGKYDPMMGQYSMQDSVEYLDPNPSTWVRIPDRPTASIKFQKQESPFASPLPPPPSLQFNPDTLLEPLPSLPAPMVAGFSNHLPPRLLLPNAGFAPQAFNRLPPAAAPLAGQGLMTSESQNDYSQAQGQKAQEAQPGFGGISLSFGNGRSISFGGGQGLTIGGRAGAISIGGKGGASGGADNTAAASGYSESKGAGSGGYSSGYGQQQQSGYSSGSGYGDGYVSKHPTMSVDVPRKGKTIMHANLDMAPIKVRLHSSPRVKITTGSRDPLEKPGDDEQAEEEEDIFEPPEPFPKQNSSATAANETSSANGTETTTVNPMTLEELNNKNPQKFNQQAYNVPSQQNGYGGQFHHHQQQYSPHHNQPYQSHHRGQDFSGNQQQFHHYPPQPVNPQYNVQVPFDEPPHYPPQQAPHFNQPDYQQQQGQYQQFHANDGRPGTHMPNQPPPMMDRPMMPQPMMPPMEQGSAFSESPPTSPPPSQQSSEQPMDPDQRPAVNQWRQYSREARQQVMRNAPKQQDLGADPNPRFYNGGHPNSIVESQPNNNNNRPIQGTEREAKDTIDMAASSNSRAFAGKLNGLPGIAQKSEAQRPVQQQAYNQAVAQVHTKAPQHQPHQHLQHQQLQPESQQQHQQHLPGLQSQVKSVEPATKHSQLQPQESNYHSSSYQQQSGYSHEAHKSYEAPTKTYTFGRGGLSTHYGSGGGADHGSGSSSSDGFDQKLYAAKVEKFEPDAHDKREKSKVVLFLKPRISIHMANSSTTTKRPKNPQRLVHVINRPIFLNSTNNRTHHDEEFIDPDLAEPMEIGYGYGYGYGYGGGYGHGYGHSRNYTKSTTTKKPKRTTTTTTTTSTTTIAADSESTTSPSTTAGSSESEATTASGDDSSSSTTSSSSSSSTTESSPTTTTGGSSTTSSEVPSSSTSSSEDDSSSTTAPETTSQPSSEAPSSTSEASPSSTEGSLSTDVAIIDSQPVDTESEGERENVSTSDAPASSEPSTDAEESASSSPAMLVADDDSAADLIASATEPTRETVAPTTTAPPTTTTTTLPSTTSTTTTPKATAKSRNTRPSTTSTTTSTSTTTTTTTAAPPTTTATPTTSSENPTESGTSEESSEASDATTSTGAPSSSSSASPASPSSEEPEFISEQQNPSKRSTHVTVAMGSRDLTNSIGSKQQQPMLLTPTLIDKLMSNKTLVGLMSGQLKRVIDTERMDEAEKRRIVRQVFDQMMEEKVDFSMNNVRLAVKTVSSSYRAAAEKQRKRAAASAALASQQAKPDAVKGKQAPSSEGSWQATRRSELRAFGRRASLPAARDDQSSGQESSAGSKSFPAIDTALKLTKQSQQGSKASASDSRGKKSRVDASGNPIVVVLLPQEKA